jgi:hypothetical protein
MRFLWLLFVALASLPSALAQVPAAGPWRYTLLEGSTFTDDCPVCGRPTIAYPMRGTFDLLLDNAGPLFTTYHLTNIQFSTDAKSAAFYSVTGNGTYRLGGEVAVQQGMALQTDVCSFAPACRDVAFTNESGGVTRGFPLIEISVVQTQASLFSVYTMNIVAAPARELWFTVTNGFTPTNDAPVVHAGDVLSRSGRIVRTNARLLESVGLTNPPAVLRVDAFDVAPGGEIFFSLNQDVTSPTLGSLHHGDLLSNRGRIVRSNQQLTAAFGIQPVVPDVGLDAVCVKANGEILFSIRTNIFSEGKGTMLFGGDVLSSQGIVVKRNTELRTRFHTNIPAPDLGLDALYVWPNGEIWFSLETGFPDSQLGDISAGDLLSTEGIIVFKNAELVSAFRAPESASNFGLSDIFVVTDLAMAGPPRFFLPRIQTNSLALQWTGTNRVFQLERAPGVTGSWQPLGEIDPGPFYIDTGAVSSNAQSFYRLRGW